jgi:hypothetical protein
VAGFLRRAGCCALIFSAGAFLLSCQGVHSNQNSLQDSQPGKFNGVLMWKGDSSGTGVYGSESTLTPANVNATQFGKLASFQTNGLIIAQPLYVANLKMSDGTTHNAIIVATEHDSVYAFDADAPGSTPLWERDYVDAANGVTTMADNFGGRTTLGGEVGITGTPYIDSGLGVLYFVTTLARNGTPEQWLRAVDITSGEDFGPGSTKITASVPGDGRGSAGDEIPFDPSVQNQRAGLTEAGGAVVVAWGSFSDWGVYHGWLMAFDPATLLMKAVFNPTPQSQSVDAASGPSDYGGGGAFWQGGAAPSVDSNGNIYLNAADGSFDADTGGKNYGDTMLKLSLNGSSFQVLDSFTPANADCIDLHDLELGSGGVALLPSDAGSGTALAVAYSKEGRLYLVNRSKLGGFNAGGDSQIVQEFMVGAQECSDGILGDVAEGPGWNRLYGNPAYWNENLYAAASNMPLKQYQFQGGMLSASPVAVSSSVYGLRGGNIVVSANGTQNGIAWVYEKSENSQGILHAYDATNVSQELWNSNMNGGRDGMGTGIGFGTPVVVNGKVITAADSVVNVYGELQ